MAAGKITLQAADGKTLSLVAPEGMAANTTEVVATKTEVETKAPLANPTFTGTPTVNGVAFSGYSGFKNYIINGNFDIWQRETSQTTAGYGSADRWTIGNIINTTLSRVGGIGGYSTYAANIAATNATNAFIASQCIESTTVNALKGKTVTLSFSYSASTNQPVGSLAFSLTKNTTPDTSSSGVFSLISGAFATVTPTTVVQKASVTVVIPNDGTANGIAVNFSTNNIANGSSVYIYNVQLEEGSVATPFENRPYGLELSLCQRYYYKIGGTNAFQSFGNGTCSSSFADIPFYLPTVMRTSPTVYYNGVLSNYQLVDGISAYTPTSIFLQDSPSVGTNQLLLRVNATLTASRSIRLLANNTTLAYLTFSAEL